MWATQQHWSHPHTVLTCTRSRQHTPVTTHYGNTQHTYTCPQVWAANSTGATRVSAFQRDVSRALARLGVEHDMEVRPRVY